MSDLGAGICTTPRRPASTASRQRSPASETLSRGICRLSISDQKCHFLTVTQYKLLHVPRGMITNILRKLRNFTDACLEYYKTFSLRHGELASTRASRPPARSNEHPRPSRSGHADGRAPPPSRTSLPPPRSPLLATAALPISPCHPAPVARSATATAPRCQWGTPTRPMSSGLGRSRRPLSSQPCSSGPTPSSRYVLTARESGVPAAEGSAANPSSTR